MTLHYNSLTHPAAGFHLCTRNVHRVLLATTLVSAKLLDDECYNNTYWASVGGAFRPLPSTFLRL